MKRSFEYRINANNPTMSQIRRITAQENWEPAPFTNVNAGLSRQRMLESFEKEGSIQILPRKKSFAIENILLLLFPFLSLVHALCSPQFGARSGAGTNTRYWIFLYAGYLLWAVSLFFLRKSIGREA